MSQRMKKNRQAILTRGMKRRKKKAQQKNKERAKSGKKWSKK